jgi:hypothetical protein
MAVAGLDPVSPPLPATYRPRQAGGAGQCVGWPWVPATLTKRKQRPSAGWKASA